VAAGRRVHVAAGLSHLHADPGPATEAGRLSPGARSRDAERPADPYPVPVARGCARGRHRRWTGGRPDRGTPTRGDTRLVRRALTRSDPGTPYPVVHEESSEQAIPHLPAVGEAPDHP